MDWESETDVHARLSISQVTNESRLRSTGDAAGWSMVVRAGGKSTEEGIHVCVYLTHLAVQHALAQYDKATTLQ